MQLKRIFKMKENNKNLKPKTDEEILNNLINKNIEGDILPQYQKTCKNLQESSLKSVLLDSLPATLYVETGRKTVFDPFLVFHFSSKEDTHHDTYPGT